MDIYQLLIILIKNLLKPRELLKYDNFIFLKETKVLLVIITIFLWFNTNAQAVRVIDNKGTVETIRNNQVTFDNVAPTNPLEGDVWYDTTTTPITVNIWDEPSGTWYQCQINFGL